MARTEIVNNRYRLIGRVEVLFMTNLHLPTVSKQTGRTVLPLSYNQVS